MTDKWKYKSVSLKNSTYSKLNDLTSKLLPGIQLSNAKAVEKLIIAADSKFSRDTKKSEFTINENTRATLKI